MPTITLPPVPQAFPNPRFDDAIAQKIQQKIQPLSWMDRAYHIARIGLIAKNGLGYPQIQANNETSEVWDIRPDNQIGAYSFFETEKPFKINRYSQVAEHFLAITVWANMNKIVPKPVTDITNDLIKDVLDAIVKCGGDEFEVEMRPEKIFDKYSGLGQENDQFLIKRYTAFRITFKVVTEGLSHC